MIAANQAQDPVTRNDLLDRGLSPQQADVMQVLQNQQEVLRDHLRRWLLVFVCITCILVPTGLGFLIWLVLSWNYARQMSLKCDAPLVDWVTVVYVLKVYIFFLHRSVVKFVLKYDANEMPPVPPPWYVKVYNAMFHVFDFVWNIVGIAWTASSKTCHEVMPDVYSSLLAFAICGMFTTIWQVVNTIGLQAVLGYMLRQGMLSSPDGAPAGTLETQTEVVAFNPQEQPLLAEHTSCSICLDDFSATGEIRKTKCDHYFHTSCLKGWLKMGRTCPLCRSDLTTGSVIGNAPKDEPEAEEP